MSIKIAAVSLDLLRFYRNGFGGKMKKEAGAEGTLSGDSDSGSENDGRRDDRRRSRA